MGLRYIGLTVIMAFAMAGAAGAADLTRDKPWSGEVKPDPAWLTRQGVAASYPIRFTIDDAGHVTGSILFAGGANPAAGGQGLLDGQLAPDALNLTATVEGGPDLAAALRPKAQVRISLTGYRAVDGSLEGVGLINMGDLGCLADPATAASQAPCARRLVPVKWTARN